MIETPLFSEIGREFYSGALYISVLRHAHYEHWRALGD